jgi:hypothetical protein
MCKEHHTATQSVLAFDKAKDWAKLAAMAIPKKGFFMEKVERGRYSEHPYVGCEEIKKAPHQKTE